MTPNVHSLKLSQFVTKILALEEGDAIVATRIAQETVHQRTTFHKTVLKVTRMSRAHACRRMGHQAPSESTAGCTRR
jgi:hypothetical protein